MKNKQTLKEQLQLARELDAKVNITRASCAMVEALARMIGGSRF